jgi:hypothetical protein
MAWNFLTSLTTLKLHKEKSNHMVAWVVRLAESGGEVSNW